MSRANLAGLIARAADPTYSAEGRHAAFIVEVLREWDEPISSRELAELLGWGMWKVSTALTHAVADGRVGAIGRGVARRYFADPDLAAELVRPLAGGRQR